MRCLPLAPERCAPKERESFQRADPKSSNKSAARPHLWTWYSECVTGLTRNRLKETRFSEA